MKRFFPALAAAAVLLGAAACSSLPRTALDPAARDFYETARLVMTGEEDDIFQHLPDAESRREFISDFWSKRDPDPETESNEFREEFERRIEYADKHFKEGRRGMNTDRGRIYVYLGPPEFTDFYPAYRDETGMGPILLWVYYSYDLAIQFNDPKGLSAYTMTDVEGNLMQAIQDAKLGAIAQSAGSLGRFLKFDLTYDKSKKSIDVKLPLKRINFKEEAGMLKADFEFSFYIYTPGAASKEKFTETRTIEGKPEDLERMKEVAFIFPHELPAGKLYIDAVVIDKSGPGKSRRIFTVRN
jgi:GWxTD domain-containing protein